MVWAGEVGDKVRLKRRGWVGLCAFKPKASALGYCYFAFAEKLASTFIKITVDKSANRSAPLGHFRGNYRGGDAARLGPGTKGKIKHRHPEKLCFGGDQEWRSYITLEGGKVRFGGFALIKS